MNTLLTTKQVQELLKVDRITIYRMLNDGRLKGVKIGKEWRFQRAEIEQMVGSAEAADVGASAEAVLTEFPAGCVEKVEELFGSMLGIAVTTAALDGEPLNAIVNPNPYCQCILSSEAGRRECRAAWGRPAAGEGERAFRHACHAGLNFYRYPIDLNGRPAAWIIAGQFRVASADPRSDKEMLDRISARYRIERRPLAEALDSVPLLSPERQLQVEAWSPRLARTIQSILQEQRKFTERLQQIANLSTVQTVLRRDKESN
jgi:excisionase family DNA binding protein